MEGKRKTQDLTEEERTVMCPQGLVGQFHGYFGLRMDHQSCLMIPPVITHVCRLPQGVRPCGVHENLMEPFQEMGN